MLQYKRPLVLVGTRLDMEPLLEIAELNGIPVLGVLDRFYEGQKFQGLDVIGSDLDLLDSSNQDIQDLVEQADFFVSTFFGGYTNTNVATENTFSLRLERINLVKQAGCNLANLIHPDASISKTARVGRNTLVMKHSIIESHCDIGSFCTVMYYNVIAHHSRIGHNCAFMPGSMCAGKVNMGNNVVVGVESHILSTESGHTSIGDNVIVGPKILVLKDIPDNSIVQVDGRIVNNERYNADSYYGSNGIMTSFKRFKIGK